MSRDEFIRQLDAWIADFREGAIMALDGECAPQHCLQIATLWADSRNVKRQQARSGAVIVPSALTRNTHQ